MLKMVRGKRGSTLIELLVVVTIAGILAAVAIPSYLDYRIKAKITEVTAAMDALAQSASDYHASNRLFPNPDDASYADTTAFAVVSREYANFTYTSADRNSTCMFVAQFSNLNPVNGCNLIMVISFEAKHGYIKTYDSHSTLPAKYMPK